MGLFGKKTTPESFYSNCLKKTHDLAAKHGFVIGGVKLIPELMPYCDRLVDSDMNCDDIVSQYSSNDQLLQALSYRCLMYGIILADTWHRDFSNLQEMADTIETDGPNGYIQDLVEGELGFTPKLFTQWMEAAFITCMTELGSIRESGEVYTLKILPACYQLGVSMMLSHYGL